MNEFTHPTFSDSISIDQSARRSTVPQGLRSITTPTGSILPPELSSTTGPTGLKFISASPPLAPPSDRPNTQ